MSLRIVVIGGPRTGKTTLAAQLAQQHGITNVRCTDETIGIGWSEGSAEVARWMEAPGPWLIEGASTARALRKLLAATTDKPCDMIWICSMPYGERTPWQISMGKGVMTVLFEIESELRDRGVNILEPIVRACSGSMTTLDPAEVRRTAL